MTHSPISKDLIIIGGGPAGLKTAEEAQKCKIDYILLEKGKPGQAWRDIRPGMVLLSPCYPQRDWTSLSQKFPIWKLEVKRPYCTTDEFIHYLDAYVDHFNLNIKTDFIVSDISFNEGFYVVSGPEEKKYRAPILVVATGIFGNPYIPQIPGVLNSDCIIHSHDYRSPQDYKKKKILIVGGGNSAAEIAVELAGEALVYMVTRKELQYFLDTKKLTHIRGIYESYLKELISMELIRYKPYQQIQEITGNKVVFTDWELEADKTIFATGYKAHIPMLKGWKINRDALNFPQVSNLGESLQYANLFYAGPLACQGTANAFIHQFVKHIPKMVLNIAAKLKEK